MKRKLMHNIHGLKFVLDVIYYFLLFPIAYLIYGKKKYWLISEVDYDARDNGYHLFKYLNEEHKEVNSIYLISNVNPMYEKVSSIGETLEPSSLKHWLLFIASKYKIFTYVHGCCPNYHIQLLMRHIHSSGKSVALKHGIFKNLHPNYFKKNAHLDMICCGANPEYHFIDENFGYKHGVAKYTGLARFDNLHSNEVQNEIFIMPTWRRWLNDIKNIEDFIKTDYYKNWFSFLTDERLSRLAINNNYSIYYYIHPALNKYLDAFKGLPLYIKLLNSKYGNDIQAHIKSAKLLITDFSSVFFDFAYMKKSVLFYQFDEERYYKSHYIKAYFDYRDNGFGPVCVTCDEIMNEIEKLFSRNLVPNSEYVNRMDEFFPLNDNRNCFRIYDAIMKL